MLVGIFSALIGAAAIVVGVFLSHSLQEFSRTRTRASTLAREITMIGSLLLVRLNPSGRLIDGGWGPDYFRLGSLTLELTDCCEQLTNSCWPRSSRAKYKEASQSLDLLDARWAAAYVKLSILNNSLSGEEIESLRITFAGVARVLRLSTPQDSRDYLQTLGMRVAYFIENGINADPSEIGLASDPPNHPT